MSEYPLDVVTSVSDLRKKVSAWRSVGERIALVPTMGALHEGHLSLVRQAKQRADRVCVSLFVNPTQFAVHEDLNAYPRDEETDRALLSDEKVDLLYAPDLQEMYPEGEVTRITMPGLGECLEGEYRPEFFTGVATVVAKLLIQCSPHIALFGEKDFQQLQVIRRMATDLSIPVEIQGVPTVRDVDGLALSSRNVYLSEQERAIAPRLYQALKSVRDYLHESGVLGDVVQREVEKLIASGFSSVDYLSVRDADSFSPINDIAGLKGREGRILIAAQLGRARLIDNIPL